MVREMLFQHALCESACARSHVAGWFNTAIFAVKAKSIVLLYIYGSQSAGYGYVICAFYLIMCLCRLTRLYVTKILQNPACIYVLGNKNSTQSLFRDISRCCNKCRSHQKHCGDMGCSVVQQALQLSVHFTIKVTCISVWLYCIGSLLYNTLELQVRMKFGVVNEVSTFLVITQVSSGLKKSHILIFSKLYLHVKKYPVSL